MRDRQLTILDIHISWENQLPQEPIHYEMSCPSNSLTETLKTVDAFRAIYPNVPEENIEISPRNGYHVIRGSVLR